MDSGRLPTLWQGSSSPKVPSFISTSYVEATATLYLLYMYIALFPNGRAYSTSQVNLLEGNRWGLPQGFPSDYSFSTSPDRGVSGLATWVTSGMYKLYMYSIFTSSRSQDPFVSSTDWQWTHSGEAYSIHTCTVPTGLLARVQMM